jgi:hypothetical protein
MMAIAPGDGITQAQAIEATNAARKQADANRAAATKATTPTKNTPVTPGAFRLAEEQSMQVVEDDKNEPKKTIDDLVFNDDGSVTVTYSDGSKEKKSNPSSLKKERNQSAFDLIALELQNNGLSSLVGPLTKLFQDGIDDSDSLRLALAGTDEYKTRFSANKDRVANGLRALSPAEYVKLEDQYQEVMRNYGLPETYYAKDSTGKQAGFDQLLAGDVSATELEDRVSIAQNRVNNASKEIKDTLKTYYGDVIKDGDILAYALDPKKALEDIKRKVTAAEIGGAASMAGLNQIAADTTAAQKAAMRTRSEEIAAAGVTKETAQQQYGTIAELAQRGSQLADIYKQQPYGQAQAESEIFNLTGQTEAAKQRKKIRALETSAFSGSSGAAKGALERERVSGAGAI